MTDEPLAISALAHSEQRGWRRNQDLVDAMPYIDGLTAEEKQHVDVLIEEEVFSFELFWGFFLVCLWN
jgi:hypothetical protein